ncbi:MAG TPA: hypothetical protein VFV19_13860 [Candidatus Polarisedimenticolaceae bacterium]|nr:hypothetical protein [Candidatus Polarisedimenticolaceae bacterium]
MAFVETVAPGREYEMKVYRNVERVLETPRDHPWDTAIDNADERYYDFKEHSDLIAEVLEDFKPWSRYPAIATFYELLRWINGPESLVESNDCAFRGPRANESREFPKARECTGRLMILMRRLEMNVTYPVVADLEERVLVELQSLDTDFEWGAVGTTLAKVGYHTLPFAPEGFQLCISFWAWGDTDDDAMSSLDRTFSNLDRALRLLCRHAPRMGES